MVPSKLAGPHSLRELELLLGLRSSDVSRETGVGDIATTGKVRNCSTDAARNVEVRAELPRRLEDISCQTIMWSPGSKRPNDTIMKYIRAWKYKAFEFRLCRYSHSQKLIPKYEFIFRKKTVMITLQTNLNSKTPLSIIAQYRLKRLGFWKTWTWALWIHARWRHRSRSRM